MFITLTRTDGYKMWIRLEAIQLVESAENLNALDNNVRSRIQIGGVQRFVREEPMQILEIIS